MDIKHQWLKCWMKYVFKMEEYFKTLFQNTDDKQNFWWHDLLLAEKKKDGLYNIDFLFTPLHKSI